MRLPWTVAVALSLVVLPCLVVMPRSRDGTTNTSSIGNSDSDLTFSYSSSLRDNLVQHRVVVFASAVTTKTRPPPPPPPLSNADVGFAQNSTGRGFAAAAAVQTSTSGDKFVNTNFTEAEEVKEEGTTVAIVAVVASCAVGLLFFCWCRLCCRRSGDEELAYFDTDDDDDSSSGEKSGDMVANGACTAAAGPTMFADDSHLPPPQTSGAAGTDAAPGEQQEPERRNPLTQQEKLGRTYSGEKSGENDGITTEEEDNDAEDDVGQDRVVLGRSSMTLGVPLGEFEGLADVPGQSPGARLVAPFSPGSNLNKPGEILNKRQTPPTGHGTPTDGENLNAPLLLRSDAADPYGADPYMLKSPGLLAVTNAEGETHTGNRLGLGAVGNSSITQGYVPPRQFSGTTPPSGSTPDGNTSGTPIQSRRHAQSTVQDQPFNPLQGSETPIIRSTTTTPARPSRTTEAAPFTSLGSSVYSTGQQAPAIGQYKPKLLVTQRLELDDPDL